MIDLNAFTRPRLTPFTMDVFITRRAILAAVKNSSGLFSGSVIDIGCGQMPYRDIVLSSSGRVKEYIGLDLEKNDIYQNKPDLTWDGKTLPLSENAIDCAIATEFFEHCPEPESVMKEIFRILRPGGIMFFTIPFLWPLHDVPYDQYRYTPFSIKRHLTNAGFHKIHLQSLGGWDESMLQMMGLYVMRRPMPKYLRASLALTMFPVVYLLSKLNRKHLENSDFPDMPQEDFKESSMITGIYGIAYKPESRQPKGFVC